MLNRLLDFSFVSRDCLLVISMLVLLFPNALTYGSLHFSLSVEPRLTTSTPPVGLQEGTAGSSLIYASNTSAKVSAVAPAPLPSYYPNGYSIVTGAYSSGSVPGSVQSVDAEYFVVQSAGTSTSTPAYNPSGYNLVSNTTLTSGSTADLASDDAIYMTFGSYAVAPTGQTLFAHQETTAIGGSTYRWQMESGSDASGTSLTISAASTGRKLTDRFVHQLTDVSSIPTSTWTVYYRAMLSNPSAAAHCDVDILIRQLNGTVRTAIATNVANSAGLTNSWRTLSATYAWSSYTVVNQTDYLEIDYYIEVTTSSPSKTASLRIDDSTIAVANQTRATNIYLPSQISEIEVVGISNIQNWYQLVWTVDSACTLGSVAVTIQIYNYNLGEYPFWGEGYSSYTSSSTANTDEIKTQTITTNPTDFRNATGYWRMRLKGVKVTGKQFDLKADWVEFKPSHYNEYAMSTEFVFSLMSKNMPDQLNFTAVTEFDIFGVSVTIQVWNYSSSAYVTSGEGYLTYASSGSNETKLLSINTDPQFYVSDGNGRVKLTGVLTTTTQYEQKANQINLVYAYGGAFSYYPSSYNIINGTYQSGSVPSSVQTVDTDLFVLRSTATATYLPTYNPSSYNLLGSTGYVSGGSSDLISDNSVYMTFRAYASATSSQTLYSHQDTTMIGGTSYYLNKLTTADASGTSLSAPMTTVARRLFGKSVYSLAGVNSIPASTWTMYYRASQDTAPGIAYDSQSSITQSTASTSVSWSHSTGTGNNRLLLVAVGVHVATGTPTTVINVTYGGTLLTQVTAGLYSTSDPQVRTYIFRLVNPASGANTITVNFAATTLAVAGAVTYTGVDQASPVQTSNAATGSGTTPSVSVTVTGSNRWLFGHLAGHRTANPTAWTITEGGGQTYRWTQEGQIYKGRGSDKSVSAGAQSMSWTLNRAVSYVASAVAINPAVPTGHVNADILIRQSNGVIRTTIATSIANSGNLTTTASTLSATYSWTEYTVVDQTDFLEIDYYVDVTTGASGLSAYLRIDDSSLSLADQTRASNINLPGEFTSEVEFTGTSNAWTWTQLVWTIDSSWTAGSISGTVQIYDHTLGSYPTSGDGFDTFTSNSTANIDETRTQTITTNSTHFRDAYGNWKIRIKGAKTTLTQFDFRADWVEFKSTHNQYAAATEFLFSSLTTKMPTQLHFVVVSQFNQTDVNVTIQVWNYSSSAYVTSGLGCLAYTSEGSNVTKLLIIDDSPSFLTSSGNARIKITGVQNTSAPYQQEVNQVKLLYWYGYSPTYDYVLRVVNQASDAWKIRLKAYSQSNIGRLTNCTIYFNSLDSISRQIYIQNGASVNQTGPWIDLPSSPAERYVVLSLDANNSEVSYIYVYLEILVPDKTTYAQYILTFEIT